MKSNVLRKHIRSSQDYNYNTQDYIQDNFILPVLPVAHPLSVNDISGPDLGAFEEKYFLGASDFA